MNKFQKDYILDRLKKSAEEKKQALVRRHRVPARKLSVLEKFDLIRRGKVKLQSNDALVIKDPYHKDGGRLLDAFDFSRYETAESYKNEAAFNRLMEAVLVQESKVRDACILGPEEDAVDKLDQFDNWEPK